MFIATTVGSINNDHGMPSRELNPCVARGDGEKSVLKSIIEEENTNVTAWQDLICGDGWGVAKSGPPPVYAGGGRK